MIPAATLACGPSVHPVTLEAVIRVESHGNPLAVNVNNLPKRQQPHPVSVADAAAAARRWIALGYRVDLGLMQVTDRNLPGLGLTIEQVLDPCANVRAGAQILADDYARASAAMGEGQRALKVALSLYNTGDPQKGFTNGYVAHYYGPQPVPALAGGAQEAARVMQAARSVTAAAPAVRPKVAENPYFAGTSVFQRVGIRFGVD